MLGRIASLNDQLRSVAMCVDDRTASLVACAVETTSIGGSLWRQMSAHYPDCATAAAFASMAETPANASPEQAAAARRLRILLGEKCELLTRARRDIQYKARMDIWLYFHVPLSFALLAALLAHVVAVFYL